MVRQPLSKSVFEQDCLRSVLWLRWERAGQGTSPRLRVTFSVNADRWLCLTVDDLVRQGPLRVKDLMMRLR